uniref:Omega-buthitoxin-Hf1a n=1 Tax=Hottentotta franzwerneri TaxID=1038076 RepID=TXO1A_HOTFR
HCTPNSNHCW